MKISTFIVIRLDELTFGQLEAIEKLVMVKFCEELQADFYPDNSSLNYTDYVFNTPGTAEIDQCSQEAANYIAELVKVL